jgi:hypothetical protein
LAAETGNTAMKSPNLIRTILVSATMAALISTTTRSTAAELRALVVVGIPLEDVAITYPVPTYPRNAKVLRIDGIVRLLVQVERGEIVDMATHSGPPLLAHFSERWVRNNWQFKPSTNGQYLLPISYELSS